ncbi:MAG TPA: response regulator transcription factor [Solirubrobacteraceae bacterium]
MPNSLLIVDDHPRFRANARRMLESEGWSVLAEARDGSEALREAERVKPDVVVLDVGLPDASGLDIARRLCARHPGLAVVLVSTHEADDYAGLALEAGARGFLAKSQLSGDALQRLLTG